jgi:hypothetical protein
MDHEAERRNGPRPRISAKADKQKIYGLNRHSNEWPGMHELSIIT